MHHAVRVRELERVQQIAPELADLVGRQWSSADAIGDGFPVEVLHRVVWQTIGFVGVVHRDDVGMGEDRERLGLHQETLGGAGRMHLRTNHLDGHQAIKLQVAGENDDAHAAAPQLAEHVIALRRQRRTHPVEEGGHGWRKPPDPGTFEPGARKSNGPGTFRGRGACDAARAAYFTVIAIFMPSATCGRQ